MSMAWGFPWAAWAVLAGLQKREGVAPLRKDAASSETQSSEERMFLCNAVDYLKHLTAAARLSLCDTGVIPPHLCSFLCPLQDGPGGGDVRDHEGHSV